MTKAISFTIACLAAALTAVASEALTAVTTTAPCANKEWGQCGGSEWKGDTCCQDYDNCTFVNSHFSQCQPKDICLNGQYAQCGGLDHHQPPRPWTKKYHHQTCCPKSFTCEYKTKYFSQCLYNSTNTTCSGAYEQCGGKGWTGPTCCIPGFHCTKDPKNPEYYSGCTPEPICTNGRFGQCGGIDADGNPWTKEYGHSDCCPESFVCTYKTKYFSQCLQNSTIADGLA